VNALAHTPSRSDADAAARVAKMAADLARLRSLVLRASLAYGKTRGDTELAQLELASCAYYALRNEARKQMLARKNERNKERVDARLKARVCASNAAHGPVVRGRLCEACRKNKNSQAREARSAS